ncbi:MAG TPA: putative LPS assembly protein LptD [Chitinophagaceae bacterium]|nr:putative LPS assembly protein LptD [Chitinophagaceae bacterium]
MSLLAAILFTVTWKAASQRIETTYFDTPLTFSADTVPVKSMLSPVNRIPPRSGITSSDTVPLPGRGRDIKTDTIPRMDSASRINVTSSDTTLLPGSDSLRQKTDTFSVRLSKDSFEEPIKYNAEDSAVVKVKSKKIILYGKTKTDYQNMSLEAPKVEIDQQTQVMTAFNRRDSAGNVVEDAKFADGEQNFTSDTIQFNFKTQKGLTKNTITQSGEMFVHGEVVKKVDSVVTYVKRGYFTTCNLDEPHFGFRSNKIKVINKKVAVSGPTHPEFEGVPLPVYLPFGFFPLSQGRHSGMLPPQFATNDQMGLGLEGLGYYQVINDYWDVKVYGNFYSYGSWSANVNPTYRKRYHYSGSFNFGLQRTKRNFKGDPDYYSNNSYSLTWSHSADSRARPGTSFSANVNASSTSYNKNVPNNANLNFQNQLSSSIAYSKSWVDKPYNLTISANHNQNNQTGIVNLSLPDMGFTVSTIYPFQRKEFAGSKRWYEQLGIGYNGTFRNQISFYDTAFKLRNLLDTAQWGAQHSIPITLSLPPILGGAIMVSPSVSYSQVWLDRQRTMKWNGAANKVDTTFTKGFFLDQQVSFGLSFNTALYGTFNFKKGKAIRHIIRPTIGLSYTPSLSSKYYDTVRAVTGMTESYAKLQGGLYSGYGNITSGSISFGLDNNLEMKYKPKKDSSGEFKKLRLIDGFGFNGSYNLLGKTNKLSHIALYFRNNLFEKINLNANADLSPYKRSVFGGDSTEYLWQGGSGFRVGRITSGSISMSTSFQSKPKDEEKAKKQKDDLDKQLNDPVLAGDRQRLLDYMRQNPAEFVDFNIPWQLSLSFAFYFQEQRKSDNSGFETVTSASTNFSGSFSLTPKWNLSANGYYDFRTKKLQTFTMSISREMHCWQLSINVAPVGLYRYFNFTISPKSGLLQDLRINRTRSFYTPY